MEGGRDQTTTDKWLEQRTPVEQNNRDVCTALADQLMALGRGRPELNTYELIVKLFRSRYTRSAGPNSVETWLSGTKVAYEAFVGFPSSGPMPTPPSSLPEPTLQMPEAPPPLPMPSGTTPQSPPTQRTVRGDRQMVPYDFPEGPRPVTCLAERFVLLEPIEKFVEGTTIGRDDEFMTLPKIVSKSIFYRSILLLGIVIIDCHLAEFLWVPDSQNTA